MKNRKVRKGLLLLALAAAATFGSTNVCNAAYYIVTDYGGGTALLDVFFDDGSEYQCFASSPADVLACIGELGL